MVETCKEFGKQSFSSAFVVTGLTTPEATEVMVGEVIKAIGMTPIFDKKLYTWTEDGVGFIYIQPLYESCVVVDIWPCHNGGYLYVISCKSFDPDIVDGVLNRLGYTVGIHQSGHLFL